MVIRKFRKIIDQRNKKKHSKNFDAYFISLRGDILQRVSVCFCLICPALGESTRLNPGASGEHSFEKSMFPEMKFKLLNELCTPCCRVTLVYLIKYYIVSS